MNATAEFAASLIATPPKTEIVFQYSCQACFMVKEENQKASPSDDLSNAFCSLSKPLLVTQSHLQWEGCLKIFTVS